MLKNTILAETQLDTDLDNIRDAEDDVARCLVLVDRNGLY